MGTQGNVPALVDGEPRHAWQENEKNMVYFVNKSGGALATGAVVTRDITNAEAFKTTITVANTKVLGVIPQIDNTSGNAQTQTIANNASGYVQTAGKIAAQNDQLQKLTEQIEAMKKANKGK